MWRRKKTSVDSVKVHVSWTGGLYVDPEELRRSEAVRSRIIRKLKERQERLHGEQKDEGP